MVGSWFNKIARLLTVPKQDSTTVAFLGIFQNLQNSHSVTYEQLLLQLVLPYKHTTCIPCWNDVETVGGFSIVWRCNSRGVFVGYLHRYLYIFPIHFHLTHSKSYCCCQVYTIIWIYHNTLLLLLCFTCRLELMYIDNADLI